MIVRKTVPAGEWHDALKEHIVAFWEARGFRFDDPDARVLIATRGSLWGNCTSFDMSKLITRLEVRYLDTSEIECVMNVNTVFQIITPWNKEHWRLEMDTFENWFLIGDELQDEWQQYRRNSSRSDIQCVMTFGLYGLIKQSEETREAPRREPYR